MAQEHDSVVFKVPESVLVVIYTTDFKVLLIERADRPGFWQSVTGSKDSPDEPLVETARREVFEETGIDTGKYLLNDWNHSIRYVIYPYWRHRYAPGVTHNTEHWFGLQLDGPVAVHLCPREHQDYAWLDLEEAAQRCFSPSNSEAIREIRMRIARRPA